MNNARVRGATVALIERQGASRAITFAISLVAIARYDSVLIARVVRADCCSVVGLFVVDAGGDRGDISEQDLR